MRFTYLVVTAAVASAIGGCAATNITQEQSNIGDQKLARPARIVVYDFAAAAADVPTWAAADRRYSEPSTPMTSDQLATGRKLGDEVARQLVGEIQAMGLPAEEDADAAPLRVGDIGIVGYFESVDPGSAAKRLALGFGEGSADLKTRVECYQMTERGPRRLGSGEVDSNGGKGPGLAVPLAVTIATANPIGLAVSGAAKVGMEVSGEDTIQGAAKRTAKQIGGELQKGFEKQGWI